MSLAWPVEELGNLCTFENGDRGKNYPSRDAFVEEGIPFINAGDLYNHGVSRDGLNYITRERFNLLSNGKVGIGDILFCLRGSLGKFAVVDEITEGAIASSLVILRNGEQLSKSYLAYFLRSPLCSNQISLYGNGAAQPNLSARDLKSFKIPLPPLAEQKRIAAILDKADGLRRKRRQAIELADKFLRSVFLDMFGDPVTNPKGWSLLALKDLSRIVTGNTPSRQEPENYGTEIEWIKSDNINTPGHYLTKADEYLSGVGLRKGRVVPSGSVLITCIAGSPQCIGNAAIADRDVTFNQQINALIPLENSTTEYLYSLALFGKKLIQGASTNSMKGMVSKGNLERLMVPSPSVELQKEYTEMFKGFLSKRQRLLSSLEQLEALFYSLSQRAFSGKL